jgi:hypothetical protein
MGADNVVWRRVKDSNLRAGCPTICFRGSATKPLWELAVIELVRRAGLEPATSWVETRNSGSAELTPRDRYTHLGSNQGPPLCKSGALPAELCVRMWWREWDSNPRGTHRPCGLANRRLEPLGHLSDRECGWPGTFRTCVFSVNSGVLCRLSYWPISNWCTEQVSTLRPPGLQPGALPAELSVR